MLTILKQLKKAINSYRYIQRNGDYRIYRHTEINELLATLHQWLNTNKVENDLNESEASNDQ